MSTAAAMFASARIETTEELFNARRSERGDYRTQPVSATARERSADRPRIERQLSTPLVLSDSRREGTDGPSLSRTLVISDQKPGSDVGS